MANCPYDEIVFLNSTATNIPKSDKLSDFVDKNRNVDLGIVVKREKVYQVNHFFFYIFF